MPTNFKISMELNGYVLKVNQSSPVRQGNFIYIALLIREANDNTTSTSCSHTSSYNKIKY